MAWAQPPYYVTQMLSENYLPQVIKSDARSEGDALKVTAKRSRDGQTLQLQVVNISDHAVATHIDLGGFIPSSPRAKIVEISGGLDDVNRPENLDKVAPKKHEWSHEGAAYTFAPYSFTIIRFE
jgi:alpha-L-arabinofuranosidase